MTGHRQKGDAEPLQPLFSCREQARGSNARRHSGPTRPRQGSASPPEGVGLSLDVCAGTQLPPPAPGLPSGDPGRPCEAPRRCLQATVFEPHPVLVMLCPPLPPPQKLENISDCHTILGSHILTLCLALCHSFKFVKRSSDSHVHFVCVLLYKAISYPIVNMNVNFSLL